MIRFVALILAASLASRARADVAVALAPAGAPVSKERFGPVPGHTRTAFARRKLAGWGSLGRASMRLDKPVA